MKVFIFIQVMIGIVLSHNVAANELFENQANWPLCGRITENAPIGWMVEDGCPAERYGQSAYSDAPLSDTFGPRQKESEGYRYDFHRGIDIATAEQTPVFAIAKGIIKKAGNDASYSDPLVQIRHYRPNFWGSCKSGGGCYVSNSMHLSSVVVSVGEVVEQGQLIGYTGVSESGFAHLHFEIRNASVYDPYSAWQRDAINPLHVLPYQDNQANNIQLTIDSVDASDPLNPVVSVSATLANTIELDLNRIELHVFEKQNDGTLVEIDQLGSHPVGLTLEQQGYYVNPPWFDMELLNRQYSYKNSSKIRWASFQTGGKYQSPFHDELPAYYNANTHLDSSHIDDVRVGHFNGVMVSPAVFNKDSANYQLSLLFYRLQGVVDSSTLCIQAIAYDINNQQTGVVSYQCD